MTRARQLLIAILLSFVPTLAIVGLASAQAVVQSYGTNSALQTGLIVQLTAKNSNTVQALTQANAGSMFGVVVDQNASPVTLSGTTSAEQTFVATTGNYNVLVSSQNGPIKAGDYITISSLDGIGMKATGDDNFVLGRATANFSGSNDSVGTATLKGSAGQSSIVQLGRVAVNISVGRNPLIKSQQSDLPSFLRTAGSSVSNKPVSTAKVYLALVILLASAIIAGALMYGGIRSSMTAIGRNPLSRKSIVRGLVQITLTSFIVFIIGLFAVYLLLRY
jgi:hypothetical protein